jgi:predicted Zn-dependent protease
LASHPQTQERIANAQARIAAMQPIPTNLTLGEQRYAQMKARLSKAN